ncbi:hypothetical protein BaRGS_00009146 [Batillaria attramentaria]|uniref:Uncharacterized protein n=1 Tax=Batillaria attramentaria TaxID=370345 RepID=A0ABD0LKL6_9CAEN
MEIRASNQITLHHRGKRASEIYGHKTHPLSLLLPARVPEDSLWLTDLVYTALGTIVSYSESGSACYGRFRSVPQNSSPGQGTEQEVWNCKDGKLVGVELTYSAG